MPETEIVIGCNDVIILVSVHFLPSTPVSSSTVSLYFPAYCAWDEGIGNSVDLQDDDRK